MITDVVQRWRDRRGVYRPAGEAIDPRAFEVAVLEHDTEAKAFVEAHHYEHSYPAARFRFGLFTRKALVGIAVFSEPMRSEVLDPLPGERGEKTELGRLVLLDEVPANGESWFVARCFELLSREGIVSVLSHSDPVPRYLADGTCIMPGHAGTVYQALNAIRLRNAWPKTMRVFSDGTVLGNRAISKVRGRERGWEGVVRELVARGAPSFDGAADWHRRAVLATTKPVRHPGNIKYAFGLTRSARRALPASLPYPKIALPGTIYGKAFAPRGNSSR